jgi:hypothetical protein
MMRSNHFQFLLTTCLCLLLAGCNTTQVRTMAHTEIIQESTPIAEHLLLDVGIGIFNPGVDPDADPEKTGVFPKIRAAEARFMPYILMETLQQSGNWGMVRVIPDRQSEMDVWVDAEILVSDGATLELGVTVQDSSGRTWFTKKYQEEASKYAFDPSIPNHGEPFQGLYNRIANDLLAYHQTLPEAEIVAIRTITGLQFARRFAPEVFTGHLTADEKGRLYIARTPAPNDPVLQRVEQIRERDYMFVDTLQEYYESFVRQMDVPYLEWRKAFYEESEALREARAQRNARLIGGAVAILGGILAQGSNSPVVNTAGQVGIFGGAAAIYSGLHKREEVKFHVESLEQISDSLQGEMEPHTMALEDKTVTLSGSVNEQYRQWREILREMYESETGLTTN